MTRKPTQSSRRFWKPYTIVDSEKPCPGCGYSLAGLSEGCPNCPECGRKLTEAERFAEYRFLPIWHSVRSLCFWPSASAAFMLFLAFIGVLSREETFLLLAMIAGMLWVIAGAVSAASVLSELLHTRSLRRGVQRSEHLERLAHAAGGLLLCMIVPFLVLAALFGLHGAGR